MGGGGADLDPMPMPLPPPPPFSMSSGTVERSDSVSSVMDVSALVIGMLELPFLLLRWNIKGAMLRYRMLGALLSCTRGVPKVSVQSESSRLDYRVPMPTGKVISR